MRKLNFIQLDKTLLSLFFKSCIVSVLSYCLAAWGGNNKKGDNLKIDRTLKYANKMLENNNWDNFEDIYKNVSNFKLNRIIRDESQPLYADISFSNRSGRMIHIMTRKQRNFNSFLPSAIRNFRLTFT